MNRRMNSLVLISVLILQITGTAQAGDSPLPAPPPAPAPPTRPVPPVQSQYEGTGRIDNITRKMGGEVYRLDLAKPVPFIRIEAKLPVGRVKLIATTLITEKNERIPVRELANVTLAKTDPALLSENFNLDIGISAIEVHAEAMGGEAVLDIKAISNREAPRLTLRGAPPEYSCKKNIDATLKEKLDPIQLWAARAEESTPGSIQEKFAGNELNKYANDFVATLKTTNSYSSTAYTLTLLHFFIERYNASRTGGKAEGSYKTIATETYNVLLAAIQVELPCRRFTVDDLMNIAVDFNKRHETAANNSRAKGVYGAMMTRIRDFVPAQYRKEIGAKNLSFRQADTEGTKYYKLFVTAAAESFLKSTHRDMSAFAYATAEQALAREVKQMDVEQKYQLIVEYQAKYNEAGPDFPQATALRYLTILAQDINLLHLLR